jgi:hypothetical protein
MYEIVNKGLNNLNGVFSGVTRHNIHEIFSSIKGGGGGGEGGTELTTEYLHNLEFRIC